MLLQEITKAVAGKDSLESCSVQDLKQLAAQYPWFGPAQFLLAKKMHMEADEASVEVIQRTALFFQNPLWFDHLLNDTGLAGSRELSQPPMPVENSVIMEVPATIEVVVDQTRKHEEIQPIIGTITEISIDEEEAEEIEDNKGEPLREIPSLKMENIDPATAELSFEPYHTVDYFASQGIRAREEERPTDRFSEQLRSFTEWLKTLKRLPPTEVKMPANPNEEKKVEQMAEHSISDREVVTETMAEVWEKQGNHEKALEVYEKLSLLDPSKSSYFAAKIEHLKHS
jgi:hypothetical protein